MRWFYWVQMYLSTPPGKRWNWLSKIRMTQKCRERLDHFPIWFQCLKSEGTKRTLPGCLGPHESVHVAHRGRGEPHGKRQVPSTTFPLRRWCPSLPPHPDALCDALAWSHRPHKHTGARSLQTWAWGQITKPEACVCVCVCRSVCVCVCVRRV